MENDLRAIPELVAQLYQTVRSLNDIFPHRPFTPDGHLVGSIGEVVAADTYGLILEKCSNEGFDAKTETQKTVEIKLTGGMSVAVSSGDKTPELLIVLKLDRNSGFEEIYNGEFPLDLWRGKKVSKRRVVNFRVNELRKINPKRLKEKHPLGELNALFTSSRS
jgi:hypothetical protein